ncbi:MAG: fatty acid desaturase [Phycisphaeraceae bacterium]|nr:fatty acid desaturase [Phycisphaeraceae bacterium]
MTGQELRKQFAVVSSWRGGLDLLWHWAAILGLVWAASAVGHWLGFVLAAVLVGGLQHGLINLAHEAWHRLCFKSKRVNDFVGGWFYCYAAGMPYYHDRNRHWAHHRLVGHHDDPDWINYCNEGRVPLARLMLFLIGRLLGGQLVLTAYSLLFRREARISVVSGTSKKGLPSSSAEWGRVVVCQAVLFGVFAAIGPWWSYFVLWVWPLASFASLFIAVRAYVEHAAEDDATTEERLYDFSPSTVEAFFISPCHFNYHALHHAYPNVPHYRLRRFKRAMCERGLAYPGRDMGGYLSFLIHEAWGIAAARTPKKATPHAASRPESDDKPATRQAA